MKPRGTSHLERCCGGPRAPAEAPGPLQVHPELPRHLQFDGKVVLGAEFQNMPLTPNHCSSIQTMIRVGRLNPAPAPFPAKAFTRGSSTFSPYQGTLHSLIFCPSPNFGAHSMSIFLASFAQHFESIEVVFCRREITEPNPRGGGRGGRKKGGGRVMTWVSHPQMNKVKLLSEKCYTCE